MNKTKVDQLLDTWITTIKIGELSSTIKAKKGPGGINGRIKRTKGNPVIFDATYHSDQKIIQDNLCKELPKLSDIIRSEPEIMDGYAWTRKDFIFLYFSHFKMVVEKLKKIINQSIIV